MRHTFSCVRQLVPLMFGLIAGCAGLASRIEPPLLSIASLDLASAGLFEQSYRLRLRVRNPNPVDLPIEAMRYELELNGQAFASGVSEEPVLVPRFGSAVMDVEALSTLASVFRQLKALGADETFGYRLRGELYLADESVLPFNYSGDVGFER